MQGSRKRPRRRILVDTPHKEAKRVTQQMGIYAPFRASQWKLSRSSPTALEKRT